MSRLQRQFMLFAITIFARPASSVVGIASDFKSQNSLEFRGKKVNVKNSFFP
ncbi:hypothetical protein KGR20_18840 [Cytobacillus oceanisediminis]|nr:hypothetical protein [Cytobacillus oceanisediminis]MDU1847760.1 hypothetical protein [Niallia nealsonii]